MFGRLAIILFIIFRRKDLTSYYGKTGYSQPPILTGMAVLVYRDETGQRDFFVALQALCETQESDSAFFRLSKNVLFQLMQRLVEVHGKGLQCQNWVLLEMAGNIHSGGTSPGIQRPRLG